MRFTTGQEPGDRAELGHDRLPQNLDETMMAASGCTETVDGGCVDEGSMISNLPLLFAEGYPTSLEKITMPQLERFITFMVQCSFGHDTAKVIKQPQWWPKEIKFSNPFVRPRNINESWMGNLKKLVFRCYTYHRSEYLLRFCSHLAQHPKDKLEYVDNWDSTTSLFHKSTGKLLVTFRNENMNYDKKIESPRRLLLPRNETAPSKTKPQQLRTVVQPDDIYLCDNCDAEFVGLQKMKEHEKLCCDNEQSSGSSRPVSPEVLSSPEETQHQFLEYFSLSSNERKPPVKSSEAAAKTVKTRSDPLLRSSRRIRGSVNLARCPTIPFSSPAGIAMAKKSRTMTEGTQQERLDRIERYLIAPSLSNGSRPRWLDRVTDCSRWTVTHKPNREKPQDDYVHEYKFYSAKGKPTLDIRSQILCVACRKAVVPLKNLTSIDIEDLKRNPYKYERPKRRGRTLAGPRPAPKSKRRSGFCASIPTSQKRKHPGDVNDPIIIDDEDSAMATRVDVGRTETSPAEIIGRKKPRLFSEGKEKGVETGVAVIDLCSSDDEEGDKVETDNFNKVEKNCDENIDPMKKSEGRNVTSTILTNFIPNKITVGSCVYPADSTSDWLKRISEPCSELFE